MNKTNKTELIDTQIEDIKENTKFSKKNLKRLFLEALKQSRIYILGHKPARQGKGPRSELK